MKLPKAEWTQLDTLLVKVGFGGYYDLIEVLRMTIANLAPQLDVSQETDLKLLVILRHRISKKGQSLGKS